MKRYILLYGAAVSCLAAQAQSTDNDLNQSMTLEREYSPIVHEANKVDRQPAIEEIKVKRTTPTYAGVNATGVNPTDIGVMAAGQVVAEYEPERSGYIDLSAGNYWNTRLDAGYKIGEFNIKADGFFTNGYIKSPLYRTSIDANGDAVAKRPNWDSNLLSGRLTADWKHMLTDGSEIAAFATVGGVTARTFNFGVLNNNTWLGDASYVDCGDAIIYDKFDEKRQAFGQIKAGVAYEAEHLNVELEFDHTGVKYPDTYDNLVGLSAAYDFSWDPQWVAVASVNTNMTFAEEEKYFAIKPDIEVSWLPDMFAMRRIYAKFGVGTNRPGLFETLETYPLTYPMEEYKTPFDMYDFTLGWEDSENGYFTYGILANVRGTKDELGGRMVSLPTGNTPYQLGLFQELVNDDCVNVSVEANAKYEYNRYFAATIDAGYYYQSSDLAGMGTPGFEGEVHFLSNPNKLKFDLSFKAGLDRTMVVQLYDRMPTINPGGPVAVFSEQVFELDPILDLGFRADYELRDNLSIYLYGCNLLNRKYELWAGVPAQRINIHAGFNWKF